MRAKIQKNEIKIKKNGKFKVEKLTPMFLLSIESG